MDLPNKVVTVATSYFCVGNVDHSSINVEIHLTHDTKK